MARVEAAPPVRVRGAVTVATALAATLQLAAWLLGLPTWTAVWTAALAAAAGVWTAARIASRRRSAAPANDALPATLPPRAVPRPLFVELAGREFLRARRYGSGAALLLVEVAPGPGADGDALLRALAATTAAGLRGADFVTHYAPTRLAVLLTPADATGALDVAERIREAAEQLVSPSPPLVGTASIGVAHLRAAHLNLQSLFDDAHDALAAAVEAGGNCVRAAPLPARRRQPSGPSVDGNRARPK